MQYLHFNEKFGIPKHNKNFQVILTTLTINTFYYKSFSCIFSEYEKYVNRGLKKFIFIIHNTRLVKSKPYVRGLKEFNFEGK